MSTHRFKAGDQVVRIPSSGPIRTLRTGVVAKVYKNGNFILAGDESRQQYRQTGFRTGQHGGCDAYWVAKDSDEVHQAIESAKLARHRGEARELLDRLSNLVSRDTKKDWSELVKGLEDLLGSAQSGEVQS